MKCSEPMLRGRQEPSGKSLKEPMKAIRSDRSKSFPEVIYIAPGEKTCVSDLIRRRAYELFEQRGRQPGHDVEDWLQAEQELIQQMSTRLEGNETWPR
jgi:hypothetical protein